MGGGGVELSKFAVFNTCSQMETGVVSDGSSVVCVLFLCDDHFLLQR